MHCKAAQLILLSIVLINLLINLLTSLEAEMRSTRYPGASQEAERVGTIILTLSASFFTTRFHVVQVQEALQVALPGPQTQGQSAIKSHNQHRSGSAQADLEQQQVEKAKKCCCCVIM